MTATREAALRSTQLKMIRAIMGRSRACNQSSGEMESWVEWIQRVTPEAREAMVVNNVPDWVGDRTVRLERWKAKLEEMTDERWAKRVLAWTPDGWRTRGHPRKRWE